MKRLLSSSPAAPAQRGRGVARTLSGVLAVIGLLAALVLMPWDGEEAPQAPAPLAIDLADPALIARGAYLARVGHCAGCHTERGGAPYAGGRGIATPFGTVRAGNLTPDTATGLGAWHADDFWRALHLGRSRDGRALLPVFPYTDMTLVTREDSDALFAYLRSLPGVVQPNQAHALRFPYDQALALKVWRALYFRPGTFTPDPARSADWNRGAYLVRGLGHCAACHAPRNRLGAVSDARSLGGGDMPAQPWHAPALAPQPQGIGDPQAIVSLLATGQSARGVAMGPMAEVVAHSTQHWTPADLRAAALYLQDLPPSPPGPTVYTAPAAQRTLGERVYEKHCADCHGAQGQGAATASGASAYPALAGNASVNHPSAANLIQAVLHGGFAPATAGNPRPFGMPPSELTDAEIAAVLSFVRQSWGNAAAPVSSLDVLRHRDPPGD